MYVTRGMNGSKMCTGAYRGRGVSRLMRTYALKYLYLYFCLMVSCFICRILTLSPFKKGAFVKNCYFSPMRLISIVTEYASFYFKLFFRTKVSQNAFNLNQIESYVYSIF